MIQVLKFGPYQPHIVVIDGEPLPVREAAKRLGLKKKTLAKRIERGGKLDGRIVRGNWGC